MVLIGPLWEIGRWLREACTAYDVAGGHGDAGNRDGAVGARAGESDDGRHTGVHVRHEVLKGTLITRGGRSKPTGWAGTS